MTDTTNKKLNAAAQLIDQVKSYVLLEKKYLTIDASEKVTKLISCLPQHYTWKSWHLNLNECRQPLTPTLIQLIKQTVTATFSCLNQYIKSKHSVNTYQ